MYSDSKEIFLAFFINFEGELLEVLYDNENFIKNINGKVANSKPFLNSSSQKFTKLLVKIIEKNFVFGKEIEIRKDTKSFLLQFGGIIFEDKILILGYSSENPNNANYIKDIMNIVSEQMDLIREKTKENIKGIREKASNNKFYEKFIALNNELVNLQRELTKKNLLLEQASKDLKKKNRELNLFIETAPNGIAVIKTDGTIQLINEEFKEYLSLNNHEIIEAKENLKDLSEDSKLINKLKKLLKNPQEKSYQIELKPNELWIKLTSKLMLPEAKHNPYGFLVEIHDITDHIHFNNMRNQLISFISHELRNPLTTINLSLETYKEFGKKLPRQKIDELMGYINQNVDIMKKIVNDFDLFAKTELEKIDLTFNHYNLIEILNQAISQMKPKLEKKNISLQTKFPETDISICCDKDRINQIFRILLDNSLKYSEKNSTIEVEIVDNYSGKFNATDEQGYLIKIKDYGIGIKQEDLVNIFEPFYRGKNAANEKGSGLGLTLAKRLISLHRGDIFIESEYQKGTTSLVFIPLNTQECLSET